jgi:hypothetical protein
MYEKTVKGASLWVRIWNTLADVICKILLLG